MATHVNVDDFTSRTQRNLRHVRYVECGPSFERILAAATEIIERYGVERFRHCYFSAMDAASRRIENLRQEDYLGELEEIEETKRRCVILHAAFLAVENRLAEIQGRQEVMRSEQQTHQARFQWPDQA